MAGSIEIAYLLENSEPQYLTLQEAKNLLSNKALKTLPEAALGWYAGIDDFTNNNRTASEMHIASEKLLREAEDVVGLLVAVSGSPEPVLEVSDAKEIALVSSVKHQEAVHRLASLTRSYLTGRMDIKPVLENAINVVYFAYDIYRNSMILESLRGADYMPKARVAQSPGEAYDRVFAECATSTGAIAMRPAALGKPSSRGGEMLFQKRKPRRWYIKYASE